MKKKTERIFASVFMNIALFFFGVTIIGRLIPVEEIERFTLNNILLCLSWTMFCTFKGVLDARKK